MKMIPTDSNVTVEQLEEYYATGWPKMLGISAVWSSVVPSVGLEMTESCLLRMSTVASPFMRRDNMKMLSLPVSIEFVLKPGEERPQVKFVGNLLRAAVSSELLSLNLFKEEGVEHFPVELMLDESSWHEFPRGDKTVHCLFGLISFIPTDEILKQALTDVMKTAQHLAAGVLAMEAMKQPEPEQPSNAAMNIMSGTLH